MSLMVDNWCDAVTALTSAGWVITEFSRYDPTHVVGITPSGRAFTFHAEGNTITVTVAGRQRQRTISRDLWEQGNLCREALLAAWSDLPVNQR
jgi:hypothetical protein